MSELRPPGRSPDARAAGDAVDDAALSAFLDGELDAPERRRIDAALATDAALRERYNGLLRLSRAMGADAHDRHVAAALRAELRRRRARQRRLRRLSPALLGAAGLTALLLVALPLRPPTAAAPIGGEELIAEARLALGDLGGRGGLGDPGGSVAALAQPGSDAGP